jgi:hypothetical protein
MIDITDKNLDQFDLFCQKSHAKNVVSYYPGGSVYETSDKVAIEIAVITHV